MNINMFPTKGNLIAAKNSLALARQGYDLMDKKRNILVREMMDLVQQANIEMGIHMVQDIAKTVPVENTVKIKTRSIMGTEIPLVEYDKEASEGTPIYAFYSTRVSLDEAQKAFNRVKELTIKLSTIETSAIRLATNIKKTQKRANALQNITIPMYENLVYTISNALEEKEREEFSRQKVIKNQKH